MMIIILHTKNEAFYQGCLHFLWRVITVTPVRRFLNNKVFCPVFLSDGENAKFYGKLTLKTCLHEST